MVVSAKGAEWEAIIISKQVGWKEGEGGPRPGVDSKLLAQTLKISNSAPPNLSKSSKTLVHYDRTNSLVRTKI